MEGYRGAAHETALNRAVVLLHFNHEFTVQHRLSDRN